MQKAKYKVLYLVAHRLGRSPGQRFRFEQYLDFLNKNGFENTISYLFNEKDDEIFYSKGNYFRKFLILVKSIFIRYRDLKRCKDYDLVFIYRDAVMFGSVFFEKQFKKHGAKMILDFDDAIWLLDISDSNKKFKFFKRPEKTTKIIELCNLIIVGNKYLSEFALKFNSNVNIIPTTLDTDYYKPLNKKNDSDKLCIGWTGSLTTLKHFGLATSFLKKITEKYPDKIRIKLISDTSFDTEMINIDFCKWSKEKEVDDLSDIDIGIMPLPDDDWAKGKCGFKGLQYMSLGIPSVMSPVGVNTEIITDGENGFLANNQDEWIEKISLLIESDDLRNKLGKAGRKTVVEKYSVDANKQKWLNSFMSLIDDKS